MVPFEELREVSRGILVEFVVLANDKNGNVNRGQDGKLMGLFEQAALALEEGDGAITIISLGL